MRWRATHAKLWERSPGLRWFRLEFMSNGAVSCHDWRKKATRRPCCMWCPYYDSPVAWEVYLWVFFWRLICSWNDLECRALRLVQLARSFYSFSARPSMRLLKKRSEGQVLTVDGPWLIMFNCSMFNDSFGWCLLQVYLWQSSPESQLRLGFDFQTWFVTYCTHP